MKLSRISLTLISLLLALAAVAGLSSCSAKVSAEDLMERITPNEVDVTIDMNDVNPEVTDFAVRLFKAGAKDGENVLISPLSVLYALAMTANGAQEETLAQMEDVLGVSTGTLNEYLFEYMKNLPQGEDYALKPANSVWFTDDERFTVNDDFLQTIADYYKAEIYKAPFDNNTLRDINIWVNEKTDGMIPEILDEIPPEAVMYLVNALAFEAEWQEPYTEYQVREGEFTREDGTKQKAEFMYGTESAYLEDENATGFMKSYKDGKYAFVALLPKEGVSLTEYTDSLDGKALSDLLANPKAGTVYTSIPKFETEYSAEMSDTLKSMGMTDAFDSYAADFLKLGHSDGGNIFINRVLHKTFISVGEKGTKAGAATAVEMNDESADVLPIVPVEIYLDRPFVYMLVDCENNIPFFIGTMADMEK